MRIGLVCPYSMRTPGGVQNHVLGLAGYLSACGHHVRVLAPGRPDLHRLRAYGLESDQLTDAGATIPLAYNGSVARVNFGPLSLVRVRRWLAAGDFDLVHLHEPITPSISGWALVVARVPVVATFHTATPRSRTMELAGRLLRSTIGKIDVGIAVSTTARRVVVQHLGRDAVVIPNGFRRSDFGPAGARSGEPAGETDGELDGAGSWRAGAHPRIAYLGRLDEPRKGLDVLLDAVPIIRAAHPDLELIVAGQGRRRVIAGQGRRRSTTARIEPTTTGDIRVPGQVDDRERAELLRSVDLFIAPHVARESFGIVLIEAMASGATVVASDLVPFVDLLTDRTLDPKTNHASDHQTDHGTDQTGGEPSGLGFLFPAGDSAALARAVIAALADDRRQLTERARVSTARFDWSQVGAEIVEVYRSLLQPSGQTCSGAVNSADRAARRDPASA